MVLITKKNVVISIAVLMLLVLIINTIFNPLMILVIGAGLWLILSTIGEKEAAIPDKYRIYFTFILTAIALLSILLLNKKAMEWGPEKYLFILPPVTIAAAVTVFVAITTYMKRYYPYSAIFSSALLGIHYFTVLPYTGLDILISFISFIGLIVIFAIPILVIASGWWHSEKLGITYPVVYSLVMGLIAGIALPLSFYAPWRVPPFELSGFEGLGLLSTAFILVSIVPLIFVSGIAAIIFFITKSRSETANRYFAVSLKTTLLLIVFLIVSYASFNYVFSQLYLSAI